MPQNISPEDYARLHGLMTPKLPTSTIQLPQQEGLGSLSARLAQPPLGSAGLLPAKELRRNYGQAPGMSGMDVQALLAELLKQQTP